MGSGSSTNAKVIQIEDFSSKKEISTPNGSPVTPRARSSSEPRQPSCRPPSGDGRRPRRTSSKVSPADDGSSLTQALSACRKALQEAETRETEAVTLKEELQTQVSSLESLVLDLQEQIAGLQELVDSQHEQQAAQTSAPTGECEGTLHAKDALIINLEAEKEAARIDATKQRVRLKKRLRATKAELTELRQETSLQIIELKEEIQKLKDTNTNNSDPGTAACAQCTSKPKMPSPNDGRTSIILDLSSRLSEQDLRIAELEGTLKERDAAIKSMRSPTRGASNLKRTKTMPSRGACSSYNRERQQENEEDSKSQKTLSFTMTAKQDDTEMQELRAIAREMMKVHTKRRTTQAGQLHDDEGGHSSGVSRDSGVAMDGEDLSERRGRRPTSGSSTLSTFSMDDEAVIPEKDLSDWNSESEEETPKKGLSLNIRQISAPKRKSKTSVSEGEHLERLLSTSDTDLARAGSPQTPLKGKPPSCGRTSSMRSPRSPLPGRSSPGLWAGAASNNRHVYTIGDL